LSVFPVYKLHVHVYFQETAGRPEPPDQSGGGEETEGEGREEGQAPPPDPTGDREEATFAIL
jgi:hypothetical protein